ncbi:hypothetical protein B0H13DRAFT_1934301 [Mycena leptocephala]|nr:hypothetical protein B0H13DRAFT_1934301 [Mycena leptocephala]
MADDLPSPKETTVEYQEEYVFDWEGKKSTVIVEPLLLPSHFSTPSPLRSTLLLNFKRIVALFTVLKELEEATSDSQYTAIQNQVQQEWLKVGGLVWLPPGALFSTNMVARIAVSGTVFLPALGFCATYTSCSDLGWQVLRFRVSPSVVLTVAGVTVFVLALRYICWVLIWMMAGVAMVGKLPLVMLNCIIGRIRDQLPKLVAFFSS